MNEHFNKTKFYIYRKEHNKLWEIFFYQKEV